MADYVFQPPRRRRAFRSVNQSRPEQRFDSEIRSRTSRPSQKRRVVEHAGKCVYLLALDKYFNAFEKVTPDFVTRVWLGNTYAGEETFKGRSIDSNLLNIPMNYLLEQNGAANLILDKQGAGRLYYRIGMKYAPKNLNLAPADYGFTVLRKYEALTTPKMSNKTPTERGRLKAGARVRVRLTMVAQARRYHVALVDNLPAGLEILNPELAVTEAIPQDTAETRRLSNTARKVTGAVITTGAGQWFEHQNFRDERAEAFSFAAVGRRLQLHVCRARDDARTIRRAARQSRRNVSPETFGRTGTDFVKLRIHRKSQNFEIRRKFRLQINEQSCQK
jgi:hypothetical protein